MFLFSDILLLRKKVNLASSSKRKSERKYLVFQEVPTNQSLIGSEYHRGGGWPMLIEEDNQTWWDVIHNLVISEILVKYVICNFVMSTISVIRCHPHAI